MIIDWKKHIDKIHYNDRVLTWSSIKSLNPDDFSEWEKPNIEFMQDWVDEREFIIVQTSGSTGIPQKIKLNKSMMATSAFFTCRYLGLAESSSALLCLPSSFIGGKMMIVRAFVWGLELTAIKPSSSFAIEKRFEFAAMTPHQMESMLRNNPRIDSYFNKLILGGSQVKKALFDTINKFTNCTYSTYGMTETSSHIALKKLNGSKVSDPFETIDAGIKITKDERGCLQVSASYLGNQLITTNDLVDLIDPRHFIWIGRWDNVINSGGIKLIPEKIEAKLSPHLDFRFIVFRTDHETYGERPAILIETEKEIDYSNIKMVLHDKLDSIEVPDKIYIIQKFIETENGKINRSLSISSARQINN